MKSSLNTIFIEKVKTTLIVKLNRPEVHNAFNPEMIDEIDLVLNEVESDSEIRSLIFTGNGKSFSAGADLNWMSEMINYTYEENIRDSEKIASLFKKIYLVKKPVISAVNGASIGGGMGFIATSDIVIASKEARFGLSEVRIGLIPAVISTYLLKKSPSGKLKELFLTGRRFSPEKALDAGLINEVVSGKDLIEHAIGIAEEFSNTGPYAIEMCKELFEKVPGMNLEEASQYTSDVLAKLRTGKEAQEGMRSFLEKRKPSWVKDK